jgi:DNA-binding transcriptional regulator YhcF (GntR family)
MLLRVDAHSPIPIRWQLSEQLKHVIEGNGVPREQALPSIRAGFLGINPNTVARAFEDLKRSGHVEARRGKGVFVAPARQLRRVVWGLRRHDDTGVEGAVRQRDPDTTQLLGELIETGPGRVAPDRLKDDTTHGVAQQRPT